MLSKTIAPLLAITTLLTSTSAFPSRTHCLCTILDTTTTSHFLPESLPTSEDASVIPSEYTSALPTDICSTLGPELETLHATNPSRYTDFLSHALSTTVAEDATSTAEEHPLSTTILLQLSAQNVLANIGVVLPSAPPATAEARSQQRILCRRAIESTPAYQDSLITLFVVQVIVGLAILACIAECVTLVLRRYVPRTDDAADENTLRPSLHILTAHPRRTRSATQEPVPQRSALRLSGEEKRLLAVPSEQVVFSPGIDKKQRSYRNGTWTPRLASGKKEFAAYVVEEDDDELSRPVM